MITGIVLNKEAQDLINEVATPTKTVDPVIIDVETTTENIETIAETVVAEQTTPAPAAATQAAPVAPQVTVQQAPKQEMSDEMLTMFAEGLVLVFDLVQEMGFSWAAGRKVTKKSYETFGVPNYVTSLLKKQKEDANATFTDDETQLLALFTRVKEFQADLQLDERQTNHITQSLVIYIKSKGYSFSPDTLMIFSLFSSLAPNFAAYKML